MPSPDQARPTEPAASGSLATKPLAHLLVYALDRKLTGTFELAAPGGAAVKLHVVDGWVARVWTSDAVTYLGHVLYELGAIDDTTLSLSLAKVAAKKELHGQVLLEENLIDAAQLDEGLRQQRARKLQHAFALPKETTFAFYADVDRVGERPNDPEPMDPLTAIWHGVRQHPSWDHARATIARVGGRPIRLAHDATLERLGLDEQERAAAECLRLKASTIPELAIVGGLTIQATDLLAYFLVIAKQVEVVDRAMAVTSSAPPAMSSQPPFASQPPQVAQPSQPPLGSQHPGPMRINTPGKPFASGEYQRKISFSMRAVTQESGTIRIPSPVPDRLPSAMPGRMPSPMPGRMPSSIPRSMTPMPGSQRAASAPPPHVSSYPPGSYPPGSYPPGMPPPADLARKKSIVDRAKWIDQEDYFKMLMVSREATADEIRAAFLRAAKVWHPDTLPASIAEVRAECERVFFKITTAYETLVDPSKRRAYERSLNATLRESAEAQQLLSQAEMHRTLGDRDEAEELARKALVAAPGLPEATALLAYLEACDPRLGSPEHMRGQIKVLDMAIAKDPMCARAHYYRAELHKRLENHEDAIRDLRVAVTNDPDDVDAQRELKLYERKLREGVIELRSLSPFPGAKKEKGLLDRLLNKK